MGVVLFGDHPKGRLLYEIVDGAVLLRRVTADVLDDPFATFAEWDGEIDRRAYADL